eukprot:TRINITY_DN1530_c0_g2_i5.p1 TRINITY_DN1530_c0_g2~~TRINITY_DN1530_c0_g2_i5.p1  ORF type:complete len:503 (+),score=95.47 TRINITY_DN1530_c0_g2_i5:47-1510(+)
MSWKSGASLRNWVYGSHPDTSTPDSQQQMYPKHDNTLSPPMRDEISVRDVVAKASMEREIFQAEKADLEAQLQRERDEKTALREKLKANTEVENLKTEKLMLIDKINSSPAASPRMVEEGEDKMRRAFDKAAEGIKNMNRETNDAKTEISELKTELKIVRSELQHMQSDHHHRQSSNGSSQSAEILAERRKGLLEVKEVETQRVRGELAKLEADHQALLRKAAILEGEAARQASTSRQSQAEQDRLLKQRATADADSETLRRKLIEYEMETQSLRGRLEKQERHNRREEDDLKAALKDALQKLKTMETSLAAANDEKKSHVELELRYASLKTQLEIETEKNTIFSVKKHKDLVEHNEELELKVKKLKRLQDDSDEEKTAEIRSLRLETKNLRAENDALTAKISRQETHQQELHSRLRVLMDGGTSERRDLEQKLHNQKSEIEKLETDMFKIGTSPVHGSRNSVDRFLRQTRSRSPLQRFPISPLAPF